MKKVILAVFLSLLFTFNAFATDYDEIYLLPNSCVLDDNSPPGISLNESSGTGTARFYSLDFDAATDEICYWTFPVPNTMAAGNWLVDVYWFANSTTANADAIFGIALSATTEEDADTPLEQAVSTIDYAAEDVNGTEANRLIVTTITLSDLDSVATGDIATIAFRRDADNTKSDAGGDGLTADARVVAVRIRSPRS